MLFRAPANYETLAMLGSSQFYKTHLGQQGVRRVNNSPGRESRVRRPAQTWLSLCAQLPGEWCAGRLPYLVIRKVRPAGARKAPRAVPGIGKRALSAS